MGPSQKELKDRSEMLLLASSVSTKSGEQKTEVRQLFRKAFGKIKYKIKNKNKNKTKQTIIVLNVNERKKMTVNTLLLQRFCKRSWNGVSSMS